MRDKSREEILKEGFQDSHLSNEVDDGDLTPISGTEGGQFGFGKSKRKQFSLVRCPLRAAQEPSEWKCLKWLEMGVETGYGSMLL